MPTFCRLWEPIGEADKNVQRSDPKEQFCQVKLAARLRAETTVTVKWIAQRLAMGTSGYVNNRLYRWKKGLLCE